MSISFSVGTNGYQICARLARAVRPANGCMVLDGKLGYFQTLEDGVVADDMEFHVINETARDEEVSLQLFGGRLIGQFARHRIAHGGGFFRPVRFNLFDQPSQSWRQDLPNASGPAHRY